eukprot:TRINITY_DN8661_c0_g1_i2.p1 TRINITY_DN8661_c0_g1~~TRINITY_DN8661_c0_g1_i2.p1  ORF type:complete len:286 (+),score=41.37 TRINITY_DN8661_c0_g1_i2:284-1141(+)
MLIILHDFPSFLAYFALGLVEELMDEKFVQLRNVILAAYPKKMKLVEPTTASPNMEDYDEFKQLPQIYNLEFEARIVNHQLDVDILDFLLKRTEMNFKNVCQKLVIFKDNSCEINFPVVNAVTLTVPQIIYQKSVEAYYMDKSNLQEIIFDSYQLFEKLLKQSNSEMRDVILNAIINQIRYPNLITHYFIKFIKIIFTQPDVDIIQEQIAKILFERLIRDRPHPWGLRYLLGSLFKDKEINLKTKSFFQIPNLFEDCLKIMQLPLNANVKTSYESNQQCQQIFTQ